MSRKTALDIICALLILLFVYTATSKLIDIKTFRHDMNNQPFPGWLSTALAYLLPPAECLIALCIVFERTRLTGLWGSLVLMIFFTAYTAMILLHLFPRIPCSCGGIIRKLSWTQHMVLNIALTVISIISIRLQKKSPHYNLFPGQETG